MEHPASAKIDWWKVTNPTLVWWVERSLLRPEVWQSRMTCIRQKHYSSALLRLLRRDDAAFMAVGAEGPEK